MRVYMYWFLCSQTCQSAPCPTSSSRTSPFISFHKQYIFTVLIASFSNQHTHFSSSTTTSCSSSSTSWCKNVWNRGFTLLGYACLVNNMGQCTAKPFCLWIVKCCYYFFVCLFCLVSSDLFKMQLHDWKNNDCLWRYIWLNFILWQMWGLLLWDMWINKPKLIVVQKWIRTYMVKGWFCAVLTGVFHVNFLTRKPDSLLHWFIGQIFIR